MTTEALITKNDLKFARISENLLCVVETTLDELLNNGTDLGDLTEVLTEIQALAKEMTNAYVSLGGVDKFTASKVGDRYETTFGHLFRD
jgi:hypothetical protein